MSLQLSIAQLQIADGKLRETAAIPGLSVRRRPEHALRGRQTDTLFTHLTLSGPAAQSEPLAADLVRLLEQSYFRGRGSVTTALRQAIQAINERLLHLNVQPGSQRHIGALTCAVLRDQALYMAQVGEGFAYIAHRFGLEREPAGKPALMTPLGSTAGVDIRYTHHRLQPGMTLLLADPRMAHMPTQAFTPALVGTDKAESVDALLALLREDAVRLLWVQFGTDAADDVPAPSAESATRPPNAVYLPPTRTAPVRDHAYREPTAPGQRPVRPAARIPVPPVPQRDEAAAASEPVLPSERVLSPDVVDSAESPPPADPGIDLEIAARQTAAQGLSLLSRTVGWLARFLSRFRLRTNGGDSDAPPAALAVLLAIFLPIFVVGLAMGIYIERGESSQIELIRVDLSTAMTNALDAEASGDDPRPYYEYILVRARDAEALRPNDQVVRQKVTEARIGLDRLDGITRLIGQPLATLDDSAELRAVLVQPLGEPGIYTLDSASDSVYFHPTDETYTSVTGAPVLIVTRGDPISDYVISDLLDLMWRPSGGEVTRDGLAMLDRRGGFITYLPDTQTDRVVRLGLASEWQNPQRLTTYQERVYVLDPGAASIWRYIPTGDNLRSDSDYRAITELADLDQAVDAVIPPDDGSVIILYADGDVRRYANNRVLWDRRDLASKGLDPPLSAPSSIAIVGSGISSSLFVADPGTQRIVQISRVGNVIAQYKAGDEDGAELFGRITDFYVLESPLRIYFVAGNTLYLAQQR